MRKAIRVLYQSFYSPALYREAANAWTGTGIALLAWLVLLGCIACVIAMLYMLPAYTHFKDTMLQQVPSGAITGGVLTLDRPTPYRMFYEVEGRRADADILFDTSDETAALSLEDTLKKMDQENVRVLVGKKSAFVLKGSAEYRVYSFEEVSRGKEVVRFDQALAADFMRMMEYIIAPVTLVMMYGFYLVYAIVQMLLYSVEGIVMNKVMRGGFNYSALQRITVCALVPASVTATAFTFSGSDFPFLLCLVVTLGYMFYGIRSALKH